MRNGIRDFKNVMKTIPQAEGRWSVKMYEICPIQVF